ncbi:DUF6493 family protein [uncultured Kordia sp.]|uniref:DUF6493 family protein n=1 Tax=uncultured Kordia sp. TaxID=507699 RepID=UPI002614079F|nr:DUF6493 family protein [uncultured Kordia sp.]
MLINEFKTIVKKKKDVLPFLKKLTAKEKRELVPFLKQILSDRRKLVRKKILGVPYGYELLYSDAQLFIVETACFICYNKTDARSLFSRHNMMVSQYVIKEILPWYVPKWYDAFINEETPWVLRYDELLDIYHKGYITTLSKSLVVDKLARVIIDFNDKREVLVYTPEILWKHKITLDTHFWYFFQEESLLHDYKHYWASIYEGEKKDLWIETILNLIKDNRIDRKKLIEAIILSGSLQFEKALSNWFLNLLKKIAPEKEELLTLQDALFVGLNSIDPTIVQSNLRYVKLIASEPKFNRSDFIEYVSILLSSETKTVVSDTLIILERIAKIETKFHVIICEKATEALLHADEKVQIKAAKIIRKYGDVSDKKFQYIVQSHTNNLFNESKGLLKEYLDNSTAKPICIKEESTKEVIDFFTEDNKLSVYETVDDLIFLVQQAFHNNDIHYVDLVMHAVPKLTILINDENSIKFVPIVKRFLENVIFIGGTDIGSVDFAVLFYLYDFGKFLEKKYPLTFQDAIKEKEQRIKELLKRKASDDEFVYYSDYKGLFKDLEEQSVTHSVCKIHLELLKKSKEYIQSGCTIPLLSLPTHLPFWITPQVLIDRIVLYYEQKIEINIYDFQIAIGRLPIQENSKGILEEIERIQNVELKAVFKYHFDLEKIQNSHITKPAFWLQSVISKNNKEDSIYFETKILKQSMFTIEKLPKFTDISILKNNTLGIPCIYNELYFSDYFYEKGGFPYINTELIAVMPNNPTVFLSNAIEISLQESTFSNESTNMYIVSSLQLLHEIWHRYNYKETTYLFVSIGMLCSNKTAREIAAEIWIKGVSNDIMNTTLVGTYLGKLQYDTYAPMKRFTDIIEMQLLHISKKHDVQLFKLLSIMIRDMHDTPLRGGKKLLELFLELKRSFPTIPIDTGMREKLMIWKETKSLQSVINKLLKN